PNATGDVPVLAPADVHVVLRNRHDLVIQRSHGTSEGTDQTTGTRHFQGKPAVLNGPLESRRPCECIHDQSTEWVLQGNCPISRPVSLESDDLLVALAIHVPPLADDEFP